MKEGITIKVGIVVLYGEKEMKLEMDRTENSGVAGKDVKGVHLISLYICVDTLFIFYFIIKRWKHFGDNKGKRPKTEIK